MAIRTDLAMEARELWQEQAPQMARLPGVEERTVSRRGFPVTAVRILDERGEQALGKPRGTYLTVELGKHWRSVPAGSKKAAAVLAAELKRLLPCMEGTVLTVGLGNPAVTPDAVGPRTLDKLLITRHLVRAMPDRFGTFRAVAALSPGVLGTTGLESAEVVRSVVERVEPALVIVVDALAARSTDRLCTTVQLSDAGIVPGSGVGNSREAFNESSLGVPVVSVGVPTVVDASTLAQDLMGAEPPEGSRPGLVVTPADIDAHVSALSRLLAGALNLTLQNGMTLDELESLVP